MAYSSQRQRRSTLPAVVLALAGAVGLWMLHTALPGFVAPLSGSERSARTARAAEGFPTPEKEKDDGGFMKFLKVEQDIELTPEEFSVALEQEVEAQRKKYYIGGEVKPNNLIVPWKPVDEKALEKEARRMLKKNGITDPSGPGDEEEEDTQVDARIVGEQDVVLEWAGGSPGQKVGYIVERKPISATNFQEIATYENMDTSYLLVKEYPGHEYEYTDELVRPGSWTYRVLVRSRSGDVKVVDQKDIVVPELGGIDNGFALIAFLVFSFLFLGGSFLADQGPGA